MSRRTSYQLLFLCSGNYYRSRFSEILFNQEAERLEMPWHAISLGLTVDRPGNNVGPIAAPAVAGLRDRGIEPPPHAIARYPRQVTERHLATADRIVAVKEAEHRPLMQERFPAWEDRVTYWSVHDLDQAPAQEALRALDSEVRALIAELQGPGA